MTESHPSRPTAKGPRALPETLTEAPISNGLVVPYITLSHVDRTYRPVWGAFDPLRRSEILGSRMCQVCGGLLPDEVIVYFRTEDYRLGVAPEPGLCPCCAEYAVRACPVLAGRIHRYSPHPETRFTRCADPVCLCSLWVIPTPGSPGAGRPIEAWYAILLPLAEYRVITVEATEHNPAVAGIDLHSPSLLNRLRKIREAADSSDDGHPDPLAMMLAVQNLFGGDRA